MRKPEPPDLEGMQFGAYKIGRRLGVGGFGIVYAAIDTKPTSPRFGREVALKIPAADLDTDDDLVREAQRAAALHHENIVPVYQVDEHEGVTFLTMMLVDGGPLRIEEPLPDVAPMWLGVARLKRRADMEARARRSAETVSKIARAIHAAHRLGILHRDLKPTNVLIDSRTGQPLVTDFGLAERREDGDDERTNAGTPEYMAPERWKQPPDPASTQEDIWSAGILLYELLSGRPPFRRTRNESSLEELIRKIVRDPPRPLPKESPADLVAICLRCLAKDPAGRYASADDLAGDLERFLAHEPVEARPLGFVRRTVRRARHRPFMAAFSVVLLAVMSFAAVAELSRIRTQEAAVHVANFAAERVADLTAVEFRRYVAALETAGRDPRVALAISDPEQSHAICVRLLADAFATANLFDIEGKMVARAPFIAKDNRGRVYRFRDYFRGAEEMAKLGPRDRKAYVSRAYRSEADGRYELAISFPVFDAADRWVGVLAGSMYSGSTLGMIDLRDKGLEGVTAALLAPRDRERDQPDPDPNPIVIVHRTLGIGQAMPADPVDALGTGGFVRLVPVQGTPLSILVRVAFDGRREGR
jgi:hypothetical protein